MLIKASVMFITKLVDTIDLQSFVQVACGCGGLISKYQIPELQDGFKKSSITNTIMIVS